jgi:DNA-directed RNA polymerase subunit RPC12/RpoP
MQIACLRCKAELRTYFIAEMTFLSYDVGHSHAMLECPQCGHVEFLAKNSPVLKELEVIPTFFGDGD